MGTDQVQLSGSDDDSAPFVRKGWSGQVGNRLLDKDKLKSFRLELSFDGSGVIHSIASGIVFFSNMNATYMLKNKVPEGSGDVARLVFIEFDNLSNCLFD